MNEANFLPSASLPYEILPTNLVACKPAFYTFYTLHLRWNGTMRHCFYHKDLGKNTVFHNFARQIALIQYSRRSKNTWAFSETIHWRNFQNHLLWPASSLFWQMPNLQWCCQVFEWTLIQLRFNIIKNLLCLFFIQWFCNDV